jgi:hypothetical protein
VKPALAFFAALAESISNHLPKAKVCPCHGDCLKPGKPRRHDCHGENPSGCRNCLCFGLVSVEDWEKLTQERQINSPIKTRRRPR